MRLARNAFFLASAILVASGGGCENERSCTPGEWLACYGMDGCSGYQLCNENGAVVGACECESGGAAAAGNADGGISLGAAGGAAGSGGTGGSGGSGGKPSKGGSSGSGGSDGGAAGSVPTTCGDSVIQLPEECDGTAMGNRTCDNATAGAMPNGALGCSADCTLDTSGCLASVNSCALARNGVCNEPTDCVVGTDAQDCCRISTYYCQSESEACYADSCCNLISDCAVGQACAADCYDLDLCVDVIDGCGGPSGTSWASFSAMMTCFAGCE